eukprot:3531676-Rhodomonas_salina.3
MGGWMDGWVEGGMDEQTDGEIDGTTDGRIDRRTQTQAHRQTQGERERAHADAVSRVRSADARPIQEQIKRGTYHGGSLLESDFDRGSPDCTRLSMCYVSCQVTCHVTCHVHQRCPCVMCRAM